MTALSRYVLPHFPQAEWDKRSTEITQEWNNKVTAIVRHESKHPLVQTFWRQRK